MPYVDSRSCRSSHDALVLRAPQHVDHVPHAEPLAQPIDAGQRLLRVLGGVVQLGRIETHVAVAAIGLHPLAQVPEQRPPPAGERLGEAHHGAQLVLLHRDPLLVLPRLDERPHPGHVLPAEQQQRLRRQPVPARPADLLVVALEMLRQVPVDHEPDVGLVDTHPEGDRRHHDLDLVENERFLDPVPLLRRQPRVVGVRGDAALAQVGGQLLRPLARGAVDDAGLALVRRQKTLKLSMRVMLLHHLQPDVRPVEAGDEAGGPLAAPACRRMSSRVCGSAVAVRATSGTPGKRSRSCPSATYSGRKSCPHCEMQCASSTAMRATPGAGTAPSPQPRRARSRRRLAQRRQPLEEAVAHHPLRRHVEQVEPPAMRSASTRRAASPSSDEL